MRDVLKVSEPHICILACERVMALGEMLLTLHGVLQGDDQSEIRIKMIELLKDDFAPEDED